MIGNPTGQQSPNDIVPDNKELVEYNDILDYYWKYFELQSSQRNQIISQYITLVVALLTGFTAFEHFEIEWACSLLLILFFVALMFEKMFKRTTALRNEARTKLKELEEELFQTRLPNTKWLITNVECKTETENTHTNILTNQFKIVEILSLLGFLLYVCSWIMAHLCPCLVTQ